jgi:hypothetical protein
MFHLLYLIVMVTNGIRKSVDPKYMACCTIYVAPKRNAKLGRSSCHDSIKIMKKDSGLFNDLHFGYRPINSSIIINILVHLFIFIIPFTNQLKVSFCWHSTKQFTCFNIDISFNGVLTLTLVYKKIRVLILVKIIFN